MDLAIKKIESSNLHLHEFFSSFSNINQLQWTHEKYESWEKVSYVDR